MIRKCALGLLLFHLAGGAVCDPETRRQSIPVMYVRGSHYDVGYDVGRTFGSLIKSFMKQCERLRHFTAEYETQEGRAAYDLTLANMRTRFPYYVKEIQGVADGAQVPFYQLFLLQMDDVIDTINENAIGNNTSGCSSIGVNEANEGVLGHTEDAFAETLNHFYILSAHVIPTAEDKAAGAREERFASLCYAGHLPGYTMGFNHHGLVYSINTLSPSQLVPGNTPRTFITRSLLSATDFKDAERIIRDKGSGAANGCSLNIFFLGPRTRTLHNVEMAPNPKGEESLVSVKEYADNSEFLLHCNKYQRLRIPEVNGPIIDSTNHRMAALKKYSQPRNKLDVIQMLSDTNDTEYNVFHDLDGAVVKTIAVGIFDLNERTWSLYTDKPSCSEPVAVLPMFQPVQQTTKH